MEQGTKDPGENDTTLEPAVNVSYHSNTDYSQTYSSEQTTEQTYSTEQTTEQTDTCEYCISRNIVIVLGGTGGVLILFLIIFLVILIVILYRKRRKQGNFDFQSHTQSSTRANRPSIIIPFSVPDADLNTPQSSGVQLQRVHSRNRSLPRGLDFRRSQLPAAPPPPIAAIHQQNRMSDVAEAELESDDRHSNAQMSTTEDSFDSFDTQEDPTRPSEDGDGISGGDGNSGGVESPENDDNARNHMIQIRSSV